MAQLINPRGLDARAAYAETMNALVEQLTTRVGSVDNGERFMREKHNPVVPMPAGPKIFETTGPWEDYATPSRDMRLLIALRVLTGLPARIALHPELFVATTGTDADWVVKLIDVYPDDFKNPDFEEGGPVWEPNPNPMGGYQQLVRGDGSTFRLSVADILARRPALEMAYNPNDCVEIRWGAGDGTADASTCQRRAPDEQRTRMQEYRAWFREAQRPPR